MGDGWPAPGPNMYTINNKQTAASSYCTVWTIALGLHNTRGTWNSEELVSRSSLLYWIRSGESSCPGFSSFSSSLLYHWFPSAIFKNSGCGYLASCGQKDRPREGDLFCYSHPQKWVPYAMYFAHILLMKFYWDLRPKIRLRLNRSTFGPFVVEVGDFSWFQINLTYIVHLIQFLIILFWLFSDFWSKRSPSEFKKIVLDTQ